MPTALANEDKAQNLTFWLASALSLQPAVQYILTLNQVRLWAFEKGEEPLTISGVNVFTTRECWKLLPSHNFSFLLVTNAKNISLWIFSCKLSMVCFTENIQILFKRKKEFLVNPNHEGRGLDSHSTKRNTWPDFLGVGGSIGFYFLGLEIPFYLSILSNTNEIWVSLSWKTVIVFQESAINQISSMCPWVCYWVKVTGSLFSFLLWNKNERKIM